jgi:hypothetical protein
MDVALIVQIAMLIPMGYLAGWIKVLQGKVDAIKQDTYNKADTDRMIQLLLAPLEKDIEHIRQDMSEIKKLLERMADGKV